MRPRQQDAGSSHLVLTEVSWNMKIWKLIISLFLQSIRRNRFFVYNIYTHVMYHIYVHIYVHRNVCIYIYTCFLSPHVLQLSISNSLHFANVSFSKQTNPPVVSVRRASSRHQLGQKPKFGRNLAPTWRYAVCRNLGKPGRRCLNWLSVLAYSWHQRIPGIESQVDLIPHQKKIRVCWNWHHTPCH